jgi:PAS domain S-box-containing protein
MIMATASDRGIGAPINKVDDDEAAAATALSSSSSSFTSETPSSPILNGHVTRTTSHLSKDEERVETRMSSSSSLMFDQFQWIQYVSFPAFVVTFATEQDMSRPQQEPFIVAAWNSSAARITQIDAKDALNRPLLSIVNKDNNHDQTYQSLSDALRKAWKDGVMDSSSSLSSFCSSTSSSFHTVVRNIQFQTTQSGSTSRNQEASGEGTRTIQILHPQSSSSRPPPLPLLPPPQQQQQQQFQIKISTQKNPRSAELLGLICILEMEEQSISQLQSQSPHIPSTLTSTPASTAITTQNQACSTGLDTKNILTYTSLENGKCISDAAAAHHVQQNQSTADRKVCDVNVSSASLGLLCGAATAEEYRMFLETANVAIFGVDRDGVVNEWNRRMESITGIPKGKAIGKLLVDETLTMPVMRDAVETVILNAFRGRGTSNLELEIITHNPNLRSSSRRASMFGGPLNPGECSRFLLVNVTPRRNLEQEIVGAVAIAHDVTEACNHDRAVAAMANELRQLIDTANAPIFGIDRDG